METAISNKEVEKVLQYYLESINGIVPDKEKQDAYIKGLLAGANGLAESIKFYMELH